MKSGLLTDGIGGKSSTGPCTANRCFFFVSPAWKTSRTWFRRFSRESDWHCGCNGDVFSLWRQWRWLGKRTRHYFRDWISKWFGKRDWFAINCITTCTMQSYWFGFRLVRGLEIAKRRLWRIAKKLWLRVSGSLVECLNFNSLNRPRRRSDRLWGNWLFTWFDVYCVCVFFNVW